jgi:ABC-type iron transport system FetAB ATPase subunit
MNTAFFVKHPRRIDDLRVPHLVGEERPYEIVREIVLPVIDYENFITDMSADRQFLEDNAALCSEGEIMRCLLIRQRGGTGGVLVLPENGAFAAWAAYV